jgi:type I restriction enzyme R subunit
MLLTGLKDINSEKIKQKKVDDILNLFDRDATLRKKKDLIKKFIEENVPHITESQNMQEELLNFFNVERKNEIRKLSEHENLSFDQLENLIGEYLYTQKMPRAQTIADLFPVQPKIKERSGIIERIRNSMTNIIEKFDW